MQIAYSHRCVFENLANIFFFFFKQTVRTPLQGSKSVLQYRLNKFIAYVFIIVRVELTLKPLDKNIQTRGMRNLAQKKKAQMGKKT